MARLEADLRARAAREGIDDVESIVRAQIASLLEFARHASTKIKGARGHWLSLDGKPLGAPNVWSSSPFR